MAVSAPRVINMDLKNFIPLVYPNIQEGWYLINKFGDIYSINKKRLLIPFYWNTNRKEKYKNVHLTSLNKKQKTIAIHILVCYCFNGPPPSFLKDPVVNHIDENKENNYFENLEWIERAINSKIKTKNNQGMTNGSVKLTEMQVKEILELLKQGETGRKIANLYGVSEAQISRIKNKVNWRFISEDQNGN